jgi:hypothetical protein
LARGAKASTSIAAGEVLAVAEKHRRPQARGVVKVVVRLGQAEEGVRVEPVVDLGPIDPDQDDLAAPLDGDLGLGGQRNAGHAAFVVERGNRGTAGLGCLERGRGPGAERLVRGRAGVLRRHGKQLLRGKMARGPGSAWSVSLRLQAGLFNESILTRHASSVNELQSVG